MLTRISQGEPYESSFWAFFDRLDEQDAQIKTHIKEFNPEHGFYRTKFTMYLYDEYNKVQDFENPDEMRAAERRAKQRFLEHTKLKL